MTARSTREREDDELVEAFLDGGTGRHPPQRAIVWSFVLSLVGGLSFFVPWWFAVSAVFFAPAALLVLRPAGRVSADGFRRVARVALGFALCGLLLWLLWFGTFAFRFPDPAWKILAGVILVLLLEGLAFGLSRP